MYIKKLEQQVLLFAMRKCRNLSDSCARYGTKKENKVDINENEKELRACIAHFGGFETPLH